MRRRKNDASKHDAPMEASNDGMWCYEPTANLINDHQGRPIVYVTLYCDDIDEATNEEAFKLYLEPLEAKRLGLDLMRVGQDGIEAEIERERQELAKSWNPERRGQSNT